MLFQFHDDNIKGKKKSNNVLKDTMQPFLYVNY